jgi:hypothetical protein
MTTCKSILAILISPTNSKVITCVSTVLNTIINKLFLPFTITVIVIMLHSKASSTYILM